MIEDYLRGFMLNTLVFKLTDYEGFAWVLYNGTHEGICVYKGFLWALFVSKFRFTLMPITIAMAMLTTTTYSDVTMLFPNARIGWTTPHCHLIWSSEPRFLPCWHWTQS